MGEDLNDAIAVGGILVMEMGIHTAHQVGTSGLQILKGFLGGFQLDAIGYVELIANQSQ